jgi:NADP-dependent 3-hydroxy acid dehydrogenase YdfG
MARPLAPTISGRTAVITGAGSGIGQAVAVRLSRFGCPLVLLDWNEDGLADTAAQVSTPTLVRKLDVRDRQAQMVIAAEAADWAPQPIGLVMNNAGVTATQPVEGAAMEDDQWVLDVNLHGVMHGTQAYLPILLKQNSGVIANTSSVFGLIGFPHQSAYCASKFAVRGYTETLRRELQDTGVNAVTIHPGGVTTNIMANARFHTDPLGGERGHDDVNALFAKATRTTPEKAAKIIHSGLEAGKSRIRIGGDAVFLDLLVRAAPTRYADVLDWLGERELRRQEA